MVFVYARQVMTVLKKCLRHSMKFFVQPILQ